MKATSARRATRPAWRRRSASRIISSSPRASGSSVGPARRPKPRAACTLAFDCLQSCGLRDGLARAGQFCIDLQLAAALKGDLQHGLFFRGGGRLPFGDRIRPVRELLAYLLAKPGPQPA